MARIRAQGAPFGEILPKPWRVDDLLKTVDVAIRIRRLEDSTLMARRLVPARMAV